MGTGINYLFNKSSLSQAKPLRKQRTQSGMLGKQKSLGDVKFGGGGIPSWSRGSPRAKDGESVACSFRGSVQLWVEKGHASSTDAQGALPAFSYPLYR